MKNTDTTPEPLAFENLLLNTGNTPECQFNLLENNTTEKKKKSETNSPDIIMYMLFSIHTLRRSMRRHTNTNR